MPPSRHPAKSCGLFVVLKSILSVLLFCLSSSMLVAAQPNILFISVDDLNDWITPLGGHPNAKTPNFERLAEMGTTFTHAYCPAPACNPSRVALMTGIRPHRSGVYENNSVWRNSPRLSKALTLPQYFRLHGYYATGSGKIFHTNFPDPDSWDEYYPSKRVQRPIPPLPAEGTSLNGLNKGHFDWGQLDFEKEEFSDWVVADYVVEHLSKPSDEPFFLACGIYLPHLPWYLPEGYLERFPIEEIQLPNSFINDLDDVPEAGRKNVRFGDHQDIAGNGQWEKAIQGYLASMSFADDCLGRVLDALESGPHSDNTIIVLWSDHGWHLGEKSAWRKFTLWEEATRLPLIFAGPGIAKGEKCYAPANLMDVYPTLVDMAGLEIKEDLDGQSLRRFLEDPSQMWGRPSLTTWHKGNHSLRTPRWRYTRYTDGSEELYDHANDPKEWTNLASDPNYDSVKASLVDWFPTEEAEVVPGIANPPPFFERLEWQRGILREEGKL